jgi:hypothetical protein
VTWSGIILWQYAPGHTPFPWTGINGSVTTMGPNPISYRAFANAIYYTNISVFNNATNPMLAYWDGITANAVTQQTFGDASVSNSVAGISRTNSPTVGGSLPGGPVMVGPLSIGGQFLGELNNQLILANVSVLDQGNGNLFSFPNTIWWCANGLPLQWDPTVNTSAGFNSFLDVSDQITGLTTMGVAGYLFRTYGITQFAPSGSSITPFEFDHMWASERGIGNVFPWSIAQYGPQAAFIAVDNIYSLSITNAATIGGTARDAIYADLANMIPGRNPFANIIPIFKAGYVYLTYEIVIPMASVTRVWIYSFEDKNWASWDIPVTTGIFCAIPNSV